MQWRRISIHLLAGLGTGMQQVPSPPPDSFLIIVLQIPENQVDFLLAHVQLFAVDLDSDRGLVVFRLVLPTAKAPSMQIFF